MRSNIYLSFQGQCAEAFTFYAEVLGAKIAMMMPHKGSPTAEHMPADWHDKIMHAELDVGDSKIMGSDAPPGRSGAMQGFSVALGVDTIAEAERVFAALSEGGQIQMPLQQTFFAARFGMLHDRFGTPWMINCDNIG